MNASNRVRGVGSVSSGGGVVWYHVLFLVPPLLLLPGQELRAEVPCDGELHAVAYEADTLPEDDPQAPWEAGPVGEVDARIEDGVLVITAAEDSYVTYGRGEPGLAGAASYDMEVRVWFANLVVPPSMSTAGFGIRDGEKEGTVYFQDGQEKRILIDLATGERLEHPLDWQVPHVYRLEAVRGDGFRVYVDGELTFDVAYGDLFDVPGEAEVTLSGFFGAESTSYWDFVRYSFCLAPEAPERPPLAEQIDNLERAAGELDAPRPVKLWLRGRLERAARQQDPARQGRIFYRIGRQLFMMKHAGVVGDDAGEFETLLDFARDTVAPEIDRREGYRGKLSITAAIVKNEGVVPGLEPARIRLFVDLLPSGQHAGNSGNYDFALAARVGVVDARTGEVKKVASDFAFLPSRLPGGQPYRAGALDFTWDGGFTDGGQAGAGDYFLLDATVEYLQLERQSGQVVRWLDEGMVFSPVPHRQKPTWQDVVGRHLLSETSRVTDVAFLPESWPELTATYYLHTDWLLSSAGDPVIHVYNQLKNEQAAGNDDCQLDIKDIDPAATCQDEQGLQVQCPVKRGTRNACVSFTAFHGQPLRLVVHAYSNASGSPGNLMIWKREETGKEVTYRRVVNLAGQPFGGRRIRFAGGWYNQDELDVVIPAPERVQEHLGDGKVPAAAPLGVYLLGSIDELLARDLGGGMAGGARISELPGYINGLAIVGAAGGGRAGAVDVYLNDVYNDDYDADGLGRELESEIGTDTHNRDTDGDGIWDGFEVLGIRAGSTGYPEQALPTWGANPLHKDVFVEVDYYCNCSNGTCTEPCAGTFLPERARFVAEVAGKASGGPGYLENPDGKNGFSLHIDCLPGNFQPIPSSTYCGSWGGVNTLPPTYEEGRWAIPISYWNDPSYFSPIRQGIFHYGAGTPGGGGEGEVAGPCFRFKSSAASFFIHELGHNLGSPGSHGGDYEPGSSYNYKPHYISLMNYAYMGGSPNHKLPSYQPGFQWDSNNLRFSEGERRYVVDTDGNYVIYELNPAGIDESQPFPYIANNVDTAHDFRQAPGYYEIWFSTDTYGRPVIMVDWDRSGAGTGADSGTKANVLYNLNPLEKMLVNPDPQNLTLRYGPQIGVLDDTIHVFYKYSESPYVHYNTWRQHDHCEIEDLSDDGCTQWESSYDVINIPVDMFSEMSAVSTNHAIYPFFLFYQDSTGSLCALYQRLVSIPTPRYIWSGPICQDHDLFGYPEATTYNGKLVVFGVEQPQSGEVLGRVKIIEVGLENLDDYWVENYAETSTEGGASWKQLLSKNAPALAVDPVDGSLLGIGTDENDQMFIFRTPYYDHEIHQFFRSEEGREGNFWLNHHRGEKLRRKQLYRPALAIERLPSGTPRWTLWYFIAPSPEIPTGYYSVLTSSCEATDCSDGGTIAFSREDYVLEIGTVSLKNVSLANYKGKIRAAAAYDSWSAHHDGFVFLPIADGIFQAALKDVNDLEVFREKMPQSLTRILTRKLFHGMSDSELEEIERANHVSIPRNLRPVPVEFQDWQPGERPTWLVVCDPE